jgi:hypothetical protein
MSFKEAVLNTPVEARTENGMKALESTLSKVTDLFYKIGASRGKNIDNDILAAYHENRDMTLRVLQWARDVRGGAGERDLFRKALLLIEKNFPEDLLYTGLMANIPVIGRWDDLLIFTDKRIKELAFEYIQYALIGENGLCAKWMPRKGPVAVELRTFLDWSPKRYRKTLVELTKVVESQMCAKEWNAINFSHVPSVAMSRYAKAFGKNAPDSFGAYKEALKSGDLSVKVNAGVVYPYDITKNVQYGDSALADEQWKALPNYVGDAMVLPLVDVSGSMATTAGGAKKGVLLTCLDVAVSLGLYLSDKNTGPFKDLFLTFSEKSKFVHLKGTLSQKLQQMMRSDWQMSTNLNSAFEEILKVATTNGVSPDDMPQAVLILSDMQFDRCIKNDDSALEMIQRKYELAGYKVPNVVFWNLNSNDNVPVRYDEKGTALVSGFSPAIMKAVLASDMDDMSPEGVMKKAILIDRYKV